MREALSSLTLRGRGFLLVGIAAIACAVVIGQATLISVGVLSLALPLIAALYISRSKYRLALERTVSPAVVTAGQVAHVGLRLTNEGRTPAGALLLEDSLPSGLGARPRFVMEGIGHGWNRQVTYAVRPDLRGRYTIGPMTVRVADPFGLVEVGRSFSATAMLTATPPVTTLPHIRLGGGHSGSGEARLRSFANGSAEDVTVREYRRGDDLRRVHWRSSARIGELMVRREEQPWHSQATILIDNRREVHHGRGSASTFEAAVSAAASVSAHLLDQGFSVRLVGAEGALTPPRTSQEQGARGSLLDALAVIELTDSASLAAAVNECAGSSEAGGLMIGIFGHLHEADAASARRMRQGAVVAAAVCVDLPTSDGPRPRAHMSPTEALLVAQGWRTSSLGARGTLGETWRSLADGERRARV